MSNFVMFGHTRQLHVRGNLSGNYEEVPKELKIILNSSLRVRRSTECTIIHPFFSPFRPVIQVRDELFPQFSRHEPVTSKLPDQWALKYKKYRIDCRFGNSESRPSSRINSEINYSIIIINWRKQNISVYTHSRTYLLATNISECLTQQKNETNAEFLST